MSADQYSRAKPIDLRCPECNTVDGKDIWCVIDDNGFPEFAAPVESYCHDHINEAIRYKNKAAARWVVRQYRQVHFDPSNRHAVETKTELPFACEKCGGTWSREEPSGRITCIRCGHAAI